jgi:hypothetical protein
VSGLHCTIPIGYAAPGKVSPPHAPPHGYGELAPVPMNGLTNRVRFSSGEVPAGEVPLTVELFSAVLLCKELFSAVLLFKELFRLSSRTTPKSRATTSMARKMAARRPILRTNFPRAT